MKHQLLLIVQLMCTSVACQIVNGDVSIPWDRQFVKYRAAVVEYSPVDSESAANPRETILRNIQHFSQLLTQASQIVCSLPKELSIIVPQLSVWKQLVDPIVQ